jgi:hypothetical protein
MSGIMRIHVFVSDKDPDILGFTSDEIGTNLPDTLGPWRKDAERGVVIDRDDDPIAQVVWRDGFFVSTG